jgi:nitroreductase
VVTSLGLKREDKEGRQKYQLTMGAVFHAPCLVIFTVPKDVRLEYAMLDVGLFLQTFALAAHDRGLGTCIMANSVHYADHLRRHARIPDDRRIIMGAALGYPDLETPLNRFERSRAAVSDFATWVS